MSSNLLRLNINTVDEVKFIPTERLYDDVKDVMMPRLESLYSGRITEKGSGHCGSTLFADKYTEQCEDIIADLTERKHVYITTSGTAGITLMLMALGIGHGDEVICTNYSCPATVMPIKQLGATPVYTDINIYGQQDLKNIKSLITQKTKAIMITDLYGDYNDYDLVKDLGLPILNDSAQSFLTTYKGAQTVGIGDMSILSFSTNKNCPVFGTYGAVCTNDDKLANALKIMRKNGYENRDVGLGINHIGINATPQEDKCIQLLCSLEKLKDWQARRKEIAEMITNGIHNSGINIRPSPEYSQTNYHKYSIFVKDKWKFRELMTEQGVETQMHYTYNFTNTPVLSNDVNKKMPGTEFFNRHAISIPSNPWLKDNEVMKIITAVRNCITKEDIDIWPTI